MKTKAFGSDRMRSGRPGNEDGFGVWQALLFVVLIVLIVAAVMKTISVWAAIGFFVLAIIVLGLLANISDIRRYLRISSM